MFERYTEKARRVIFFARYETSQYGSQYIETEHLLLGLVREDRPLMQRVLGPGDIATQIRGEIEKHIIRGERISVSVEIPLSAEAKNVLNFAAEEAERLGDRHVGTEHLLLGMFRVEESLAARVLRHKGAKPDAIREQLAKGEHRPSPKRFPVNVEIAVANLEAFLQALKRCNWEQVAPFFADDAQFVDSTGKRWKRRSEIEKQFEALFATYARKNVTSLLESADAGAGDAVVASVLWENITTGSQPMKSIHRMTLILAPEGGDWPIFFVQVTPVITQ